MNGVDKSAWSGLRQKWSQSEPRLKPDEGSQENPDPENKENLDQEKEKQSENPGLLSRLKKAVFG